MAAELFHADGRANRHEKSSSHFSKICEKRLKCKAVSQGDIKTWGERGSIAPQLWAFSLTPKSLQPPGKVPPYPLTSRLVSIKVRLNILKQTKIPLTLSGIFWSVALSVMLTTLLRPKKRKKKMKRNKNKNKRGKSNCKRTGTSRSWWWWWRRRRRNEDYWNAAMKNPT